jgi:flagellar assembly factor FliW
LRHEVFRIDRLRGDLRSPLSRGLARVRERKPHQPLVFLQSLRTPELCFVALPAKSIEPAYELDVEESDLELLEVPAASSDLLPLALVTISETGITANLFAPILINTRNLRAVQAISPNRRYSHLHPLVEALEPVCS